MIAKSLRVAVVVMMVMVISCQDCSALTIDAIYACTFTFNQDSNCSFNKCDTFSPGNNQTSTNWSVCHLGCCPGFVEPTSQTKSALSACSKQFATVPYLVPVIGAVLAVIACIICVIIPCCINSECPLYGIRKNCCKDSIDSDSEKRRLQAYEQERRQERLKTLESINNLALLNVTKVVSIKEDPTFGRNQICLICGKERADSKSNCDHCFHLRCLTATKHKGCPSCHRKDYLPLINFCSVCFKRYHLHSSPNAHTDQFVCDECFRQ